ncbi:MAG: AsmA-like C-terminal region-containing protein, partial [Candidatus Nitrotoga sp.]
EVVRLKAEQEATRIRAEREAAQVRAKVEAEAKAKAHADAEASRLKAEQETKKIRAELDAALAKAKLEAEALAKERSEAEAVRLKAEQEATKIRAEQETAQSKAKEEAEAKARAEAETARLKGEQDAAKIIMKQEAAQAKAKMEMDAKMRAEAEENRIKVEQEAIRAKAEHLARLAKEKAEAKARDEAAARIKAEQGAAKIRAEQEAVKTLAKAKMEAVVKTLVAQQVPEMKAVQHVAITRRKPLPLGKIVASLIIMLFLLAVLLPYLWPMQGYVSQIEQTLSTQLQQPVHVGHLRATLLPQPKLGLEDVTIGGSQELKASSVVLNLNFSELLSEIKTINSLEISDLIFSAENFDKALLWLQAAGGDPHYPVARMVLQRARVSDDELSLPPVNGVVNFDGQRQFSKAVLKSVDGKLNVELQSQQSRWQIALAIKESYAPLFPDILFNELTIKGELGASEIKFHEIDGRLYGGMLTGSAQMTWLKGWQMQGLVNVKTMKLHEALPQLGISGEMDGDANFILRGEKLPLLAKAPHLDGKLLIKKGLINNIDMVETSRMPTRKGASIGRTHFDELSGVLQIDNNRKHLRQIKISAGVMSANGYVDVAANKQLSGRLNVDLKIRADLGSVPLVLSGTLAEPVWSTRR